MKKMLLILWVLLLASDMVLAEPASPLLPKPISATYAKNVIVMISDGCGFNHVKAASYYHSGQAESFPQQFFPVRLAMSTFSAGLSYDPSAVWNSFYNSAQFFTDSAASATAIASGQKTTLYTVGLNADGEEVPNMIEMAESLGKMTGYVMTGAITDATSAGFAVHNVNRGNSGEIAHDVLVESGIDVIMGAGNPEYDNNHLPVEDPNVLYLYKYVSFEGDEVGGDIIQARQFWTDLKYGKIGGDADGDGIDDHWSFYDVRSDILDLITTETPPKRVLVIPQMFSALHIFRGTLENLFYDPYTVPFIDAIPTLAEMTSAALNILNQDPDGFFLMVEGSHVDSASHNNYYGRMIEETISFSQSVQAVVDWVEQNSSWDETLLIVTSDHETGMLFGPDSGPDTEGGPPHFNPIVNNGQGIMPSMRFHSNPLHNDPTQSDEDRNTLFTQQHTNMLVPFYAIGPGSQRFLELTYRKDRYLSNGQGGYITVPSYEQNIDPIYGPYIDNTDIYRVVSEVFK